VAAGVVVPIPTFPLGRTALVGAAVRVQPDWHVVRGRYKPMTPPGLPVKNSLKFELCDIRIRPFTSSSDRAYRADR
jgi:hypothetical protein